MHQNTRVHDLSRDTIPLRGRNGLLAFIHYLGPPLQLRRVWEEDIYCTDKKKIKIFLLYMEIQRDRVKSHIWLTASSDMVKYLRISSYIRNLGSPSSYRTFHPIPSEFPYIWGKFCISFLSVCRSRVYEMSRKCVAAGGVAVSSLLKLRGPDHQRELRKDRSATQPRFWKIVKNTVCCMLAVLTRSRFVHTQ